MSTVSPPLSPGQDSTREEPDRNLALELVRVTDAAAIADERRLFYVGMTRAKDQLILSRADKRMVRGKVREQAPSRFLADIERELLRQEKSDLPRKKPGGAAAVAILTACANVCAPSAGPCGERVGVRGASTSR